MTSEGTIADSLPNGSDVIEGQVIAKLQDSRVERELLAIRSQCDRLAAELESLRKRRSANRELALRIPAVEKSYQEAIKQRQLREYFADHLTRRSPRQGRLFAPPIHIQQASGDHLPEFWTGTPLETKNRGAWLTEGTTLCIVGDKTLREAIVLLRQQDIELIRTNQRVTLLLADRSRGAVSGRVLEVAASPVEDVPRELAHGGLVEWWNDASHSSPIYQVRVALEPTPVGLPVRLTGRARILVSHASILTRVGRFLSDTFG